MESEILPNVKRSFEDVLGTAVHEGNSFEILKNGKEIFPSMLAAIEASEKTIELLTFVYWQEDYGIDRKSNRGRNINDVPSFRLLPNGSLDINR